MGKNSNPIIGFLYGLGLHMGLCSGPVDLLRQIVAGGKQMWSGSVSTSTVIDINKPDLFGGQHKEGGVVGPVTVMMGEQTQQPNAYLVSQLGTPMPAYRGLLTIVFRGLISAMSPYVKAWSFQVSKWVVGWRTPVWEPGLCKVGEGMNGAHVIYRCVTDPVTGLGRDPSTLDLVKMQAAAQTLFNEGLGLCLKWSRSDVAANFIQIVCNHVGGDFVDDPVTGLEYLKLYRGDYDIDTVETLDESNIKELTSYEQPNIVGTVNEITVTYHDCMTNKDANVTVQNLANIQAQGRVIPQTNSYQGIWNGDLATLIAMRDLKAASSMPSRLKVKVLGSINVAKGDVRAFSWKKLKIVKMPMRVLDIDRGDGTDSTITLTCAQDVYAMPNQAYIAAPTSKWTAPNTTPAPAPHQAIFEASYRDLAMNLRAADLAQLDSTSGYVATIADKPPCVTYDYQLFTRIGTTGAFNAVGAGPFAPTAVLSGPMPGTNGPTQVTLANGIDLDKVALNSEVVIDNEIMRVTALDPVTGNATLARGCVDSVPDTHAQGARVWFTDGWMGADPTEYITGETIQAKLLTRTGTGVLDQSLAPTSAVVLIGRQARPYPPGLLKIAGVSYPATVYAPAAGSIAVSWAARNRLTQADQLIDTNAATITAEAGTTYTARVYLNNSLKNTTSGITVLSTNVTPSGFGSVRVEIDAVCNGVSNRQPLKWTFDYKPALVIASSKIIRRSGVAGTTQLRAAGGVAPYTWALAAGATMPGGMVLGTDGTLTDAGTAADGDYSVNITVTDSAGTAVTSSVTVSVGAFQTKFWRVLFTDVNQTSTDNYVAVEEMEFHGAVGGATLCTGGTPFASSVWPGFNASYAFDGITNSTAGTDCWASQDGNDPVGVNARTEFLGYILPAAGVVNEIAIWSRFKAPVESMESPKSFTVQSSMDSTNGIDGAWADEWGVANQVNWAAGEKRTFART